MITTEELETTKMLAEAATPGPWKCSHDRMSGECGKYLKEHWDEGYKPVHWVYAGKSHEEHLKRGENCSTLQAITPKQVHLKEGDAEFIAHMHPQRVLAMVEQLEVSTENYQKLVQELQAAKEEIESLKICRKSDKDLLEGEISVYKGEIERLKMTQC